MCAEFLEQNYERVFDQHYKQLLHSENYVTRRQSLKLLGELLLDRHNFTVMTKYISSPDNLKLMMNMLKERSRNIQFEAFHVFKVRMNKIDRRLELGKVLISVDITQCFFMFFFRLYVSFSFSCFGWTVFAASACATGLDNGFSCQFI